MMDFVAIGDLGSNSFRLTINKNINGHYQTVDSIKDMIHFAGGLDENNYLSEQSQEIALKCLKKFNERLRGFDETQVRIVATNTFRVAKNIHSFVAKAEKTLGFPIEIISGHEEARLIYVGILHSVPFNSKKALIIDIGGGSTEFIVGSDPQPEITESLNIGCVTCSKKFFSDEIITSKHFDGAINSTRSEIQRIRKKIDESEWDFSIGSSGTAKTISTLYCADNPGTDFFDEHFLIYLKNQIIKYGSVHKAQLKELKTNRVEIFVGGLALMLAIFKELKINRMQVTDAGLRNGVLFDFIDRQLDRDLRDDTVENFQNRYFVNKKQAANVQHLTVKFFQQLHDSNPIRASYSQWNRFIMWASKLHEIGLSISRVGYHRHSSYIIENSDMPGFSRKDQYTMSVIILNHRGNLKNVESALDSKELWYAALSIRLAAIFCRARNDISAPNNTSIQYNEQNKTITLNIDRTWIEENPLTASVLEKETAYWQLTHHNFIVQLI